MVLVKGTEDAGFIQELYMLIITQIASIKDDQQKQSIVEQIQKIKIAKEQQKEINQKDQDEADTMLDNFINDIV